MGLEVIERIGISTGRTSHNEKYLATKAGKLGHLLTED
jgi:GTP cyclohydrolase II